MAPAEFDPPPAHDGTLAPNVTLFPAPISVLYPQAEKHLMYTRVTTGLFMISSPDGTGDNIDGIPAENPSVLVDIKLSFRLFDSNYRNRIGESITDSNSANLCTLSIPRESPYSRIHNFPYGTQYMANDIIAAQADCPEEINLHEYMAFSGLRSGPRLQWLNIARELALPHLSFSREEVHTLITQTAWQLGPLSDGFRDWHVDLSIPSFGHVLLRELESLLRETKVNWQEEVTVRTISA
jgi:hypothetical protein